MGSTLLKLLFVRTQNYPLRAIAPSHAIKLLYTSFHDFGWYAGEDNSIVQHRHVQSNDFVTTTPVAMMPRLPIVTPGNRIAFPPIHTS